MLRNYSVIRLLAVAGLFAGAATAAPTIWPGQFGTFKKESSNPVKVDDPQLWEEYGLDQADHASYTSPTQSFTATAWRLKDSTGAFAAFEMLRPADSKPSRVAEAAAETPKGEFFVFGNYLFQFEGWKPTLTDLAAILPVLPKLDQSALPSNYLPAQGLVPNSERYVLGPVGLDRFEKGVSPALAAFSMGAEVQIGQYDTSGGRMQLAVFSYPTPQIARQRTEAFQQLPGALAKRAGPLVAVLLSPKDPNAAERLLAGVRYNAVITTNERVPTKRDNIGDLVYNAFILVGIILAVTIPAGIFVGILRRLGWGTSGDPMTVLHLEERIKRS